MLANPANDAHLYAYNLQRLVNDFPQSGILQALLAHASEEKNLKQASTYFNPKSLFKLINAPSTFTGVPDERIFIQRGISVNGSFQQSEPHFSDNSVGLPAPEAIDDHIREEHVADDTPLVDAEPGTLEHILETGHPDAHEENTRLNEPIAEPPHFTEPETQIAESVAAESAENHGPPPIPETITHQAETPPAIHHWEDEVVERKDDFMESVIPESEIPHFAPPFEEGSNEEPIQPVIEEDTIASAPQLVEEIPLAHEEPTAIIVPEESAPAPVAEIDEELVAEKVEPIAEIKEEAVTENVEPIAEIDNVERFEPAPFPADDHHHEHTPQENKKPESEDIDETFDEIVGIENIHFSDQSTYKPATGDSFFSFDREFGEHADPENEEAKQPVSSSAASNGQADDEQKDVSKYNDEKLPYSFLWWLDKTRKEHSATYQPYVKPPAANTQPNRRPKKLTDELQQQYFENIFHITSVEDLDKSAAPPKAPYDIKRKEHVIIERFIKEEPQIRPQSSDKLDNENKAKKSSEDRDELVTETLAAIYTDQMLYHKAIASYKKLMLRFPEKSRYFADKIEQLEKKTN